MEGMKRVEPNGKPLLDIRRIVGRKALRREPQSELPQGVLTVNLCDPAQVLTQEELISLREDLAHLATARRRLPDNWETAIID